MGKFVHWKLNVLRTNFNSGCKENVMWKPQLEDQYRVILNLARSTINYVFKHFNSKTYERVMDYLTSPYFDCRTMMGTYPLSHYVNVRLTNHLNGTDTIKPEYHSKPLHVNFI